MESFEGVALPTLHHVTSSTMKDLSQGQINTIIYSGKFVQGTNFALFTDIALMYSQIYCLITAGLYNKSLIVIDEIGKMELFSGSFVKCVQDLFTQEPRPSVDRGVASRSIVVLATIPIARQRSHWLVEELRGRDDCLLFEVSEEI